MTLFVAGIVACVVLSCWIVLSMPRRHRQARESAHWTKTKFRLMESEIQQMRGQYGRLTYNLRIAYTYNFRGMEYQSRQIAFYQARWGTSRKEYVNRLKAVKAASHAYVNPDNPQQAIILPGTVDCPTAPLWILLVFICFSCPIAGWVAIYVLFIRK